MSKKAIEKEEEEEENGRIQIGKGAKRRTQNPNVKYK